MRVIILGEGERFDQRVEHLTVAVHHVDKALFELITLGDGVEKTVVILLKAGPRQRQSADHHRQRDAHTAGKSCNSTAAGGRSAQTNFVDELGNFHVCNFHSSPPWKSEI